MDSLLKVDTRCCVLCVFFFSFLMVTFFVVRLTSSHVVLMNHDINESNISEFLEANFIFAHVMVHPFCIIMSSSGFRGQGTGPGLLLVLIHASGKGVQIRDAIRNTWVSPKLLRKLDREVRHRVDYR